MTNLSTHVRGLLLAIGGIFALSPDGLLIKLIAADDWTLLFWRGLLTSITLFVALVVGFKKPIHTAFFTLGKKGWLVAAAQALGTTFFVLAIIYTSVANALIIIGITPLWSALFSRMFLKEHIYLRTYLAIPFALFGIYITTNIEMQASIGDFYALCATFFIAAQSVIVRSAKSVNLTPSLVISGLVIALLAWPNAQPLSITSQDALYLGILGIIVLPLSYILLIAAPRYIPAPEVNLIMLLEIALGSLWVWFFLNEQPTQQAFMGGSIVIITLAVHTYLSQRNQPS